MKSPTYIDLETIGPEEQALMRRILLEAYSIIHDPENHAIGYEAVDDDGYETDSADHAAVRFCMLGAKGAATHRLAERGESREIIYDVGTDVSRLLNQCAVDLYPEDIDERNVSFPAAQVNDGLGHEAALKVIRRGVKKLRDARR